MSQRFKQTPLVVVGASNDPNKYGHRVFRDLQANGYQVSPINPKGGTILEAQVYPTLQDYLRIHPETKDHLLVITVTQPEVTEQIVKEAHELGLKQIWMQPGSESKAAVESAKRDGLGVSSHVCIMKQEGIW